MLDITKFKKRSIALVIIALSAIVAIGFVFWASSTPSPMPEAIACLHSTEEVRYNKDAWYSFEPANSTAKLGLIFYPGGRVDPVSYSPYAFSLAEAGYLAVIVPMPLNLAIFGVEKASDVIAAHPEVSTWVIGGHSLGGAMAAQYAANNPTKVKGLILLASYPPASVNLSSIPIEVLSIYGTNDGLTGLDEINRSRSQLPTGSTFVEIEGGNHGQFGYYGAQQGDKEATISREAQQSIVLNYTLALFGLLG